MYNEFNDITDEELAERAQNGDHIAEDALIRRYKELVRIRAHLYFIAGADSEDVMQEGMIGLFKAVKGYDKSRNASFRTFASLCVNRQIITAIKMASRIKHMPLNRSISLDTPPEDAENDLSIKNEIPDSAESPEDITLARDMIEGIIIDTPQFLSKFEQRVWSAYLSGKNYNVIAEEMGKTPKSIDNAIQRIRKKVERYVLD